MLGAWSQTLHNATKLSMTAVAAHLQQKAWLHTTASQLAAIAAVPTNPLEIFDRLVLLQICIPIIFMNLHEQHMYSKHPIGCSTHVQLRVLRLARSKHMHVELVTLYGY
jgi:hypothetical protein